MDQLQEKLVSARKHALALANDENSDVSELQAAMGEVQAIQLAIREAAKKQLEDDTTNPSDGDNPDGDTPAEDEGETGESAETQPADDNTEGQPVDDTGTSEKDDEKQKRDMDDPDTEDVEDTEDDPDERSAEQNKKEDTSEEQNKKPKGGQTVATEITKNDKKEKQVRSIENYVRTGVVTRDLATDGVTESSVGVMIPEQIIYDPSSEIDSVFDLSTLVTSTNVTTASGTYPILKRADAKMVTVQELEENPALAKPSFDKVDWKIDTYRGAIPISEESIQDSQVPLMPVIQKNAQEQRVNTLNAGIATILKGFISVSATADATLVDTIKHTLNVSLDPAYNKTIVITQSAYDLLDQLKDNEGRYLLQTDVTSATGLRLLGKTLVVVNDELLGNKAGDIAIFIGDMQRAILFPKRLDTSIEWQKSEIYGRYLALVMRFGLTAADKKAGYYITATAPAPKAG